MATIGKLFESGLVRWPKYAKFAAQDNTGIINFFFDRPKLHRSKWDTGSMEWLGNVCSSVRVTDLCEDWDTCVLSNETPDEIRAHADATKREMDEVNLRWERDHYDQTLRNRDEESFRESLK